MLRSRSALFLTQQCRRSSTVNAKPVVVPSRGDQSPPMKGTALVQADLKLAEKLDQILVVVHQLSSMMHNKQRSYLDCEIQKKGSSQQPLEQVDDPILQALEEEDQTLDLNDEVLAGNRDSLTNSGAADANEGSARSFSIEQDLSTMTSIISKVASAFPSSLATVASGADAGTEDANSVVTSNDKITELLQDVTKSLKQILAEILSNNSTVVEHRRHLLALLSSSSSDGQEGINQLASLVQSLQDMMSQMQTALVDLHSSRSNEAGSTSSNHRSRSSTLKILINTLITSNEVHEVGLLLASIDVPTSSVNMRDICSEAVQRSVSLAKVALAMMNRVATATNIGSQNEQEKVVASWDTSQILLSGLTVIKERTQWSKHPEVFYQCTRAVTNMARSCILAFSFCSEVRPGSRPTDLASGVATLLELVAFYASSFQPLSSQAEKEAEKLSTKEKSAQGKEVLLKLSKADIEALLYLVDQHLPSTSELTLRASHLHFRMEERKQHTTNSTKTSDRAVASVRATNQYQMHRNVAQFLFEHSEDVRRRRQINEATQDVTRSSGSDMVETFASFAALGKVATALAILAPLLPSSGLDGPPGRGIWRQITVQAIILIHDGRQRGLSESKAEGRDVDADQERESLGLRDVAFALKTMHSRAVKDSHGEDDVALQDRSGESSGKFFFKDLFNKLSSEAARLKGI